MSYFCSLCCAPACLDRALIAEALVRLDVFRPLAARARAQIIERYWHVLAPRGTAT
ncbi:MAG: hypothetical protein FWD17_02875 [Polyangiaceae bacterium]|nr:hypothetical protein [Polyangiaceae bacterium]